MGEFNKFVINFLPENESCNSFKLTSQQLIFPEVLDLFFVYFCFVLFYSRLFFNETVFLKVQAVKH